MATKTYGVRIHGAGWVSAQHAAAFAQNPAARVVAVSSRSLASARRRASEAGLQDVACLDDLADALRHPDVDIVSICTPQHIHCENVLAAARAGTPLVIEKPVDISTVELRQTRDAVRGAGLRTIDSFVLRWNPLFRTFKTMIVDGTFG